MTNNGEPGIEIAPLAWLLGTWRGWGAFSGGGVEHQVLIHDFTVTHDGGPYLIAVSTFYTASAPAGSIAADASAREGLAALTTEDVWGTETLYLRLRPDAIGGPAPHDIEGMLADPAGFTAALAGRASENVAALSATAIAATATAAPVTELERRYLLTDGELMWSAAMAAFGNELAPYLTVRLACTDHEEPTDV
ncbi:protein of unknown function [Bowdeniella nasicola]|uniref:THAP4-like heme-binding domain-containing protein n=1 Tax=Bowdeniella nasicola TaxID=208480 RepID=A0A1H3X3S7_9ACTO|nr:FABP family protein [Bowdeniella nasicola]SDZ93913.1 protein of unknown function [Bowdeniella nasicola]